MDNTRLTALIDDLKKLVSTYISMADQRPKNNHNSLTSHKIDGYFFKIGDIGINNPIISAPLAGISDSTYRIFASFFGASLTFTEMVTSFGIYYDHKKSLELTCITDYERPCALQIFGPEPGIIAEAAGKVEGIADIIDINMGCPVRKILKGQSGGYLLKDKAMIAKIISRLVRVLKKPLTIKTRLGWDQNSINILEIARIAEDNGASAISIHGRTVKQGFSGEVNYEILKKVKESVKIPVIVSGDIDSRKKAAEILDYTGCDGIMIGRAVKGRMWFLLDILLLLLDRSSLSGDPDFDPGTDWKKEFAQIYLKFLIHFKGEYKAIREFRKHLNWIFKGTRGISTIRNKFFKIENPQDVIKTLENI